jgi:hypothetical protein
MKEKRMRKFLGLKTFACALAVLMSAGCQVGDHDDVTGQTSIGRAIIRIGDNSSARSLVPTDAPVFTKYELVFTASGKPDVYRKLETSGDRAAINGSGYAVNLEEAAWTVEASAFVSGSDGSFMKAAQGSSSLTISGADRNPSVHITLSPLPMDGEAMGVLTWNLNMVGVSGSVRVDGIITRVVDGVSDSGMYLPAGLSGSKELVSGYYLLQFTMSKDGKTAAVYRAVHIYPGLTTKAEGADFTFTEENFTARKYLSGTVEITDIPSGGTVEEMSIQPYQDSNYILPWVSVATPITRTNPTTGSWILDVPGNASDVYFRITIRLSLSGGSNDTVSFDVEKEANIPSNGRKDITYTISYSDIPCTVTYNAGDGYGTRPPETKRVGTIFNLSKTAGGFTPPTNKEFIGWSIGGQEYLLPYAVDHIILTGNIVCTAIWNVGSPLTPKRDRIDLETAKAEFNPKAFPSADYTGYTGLFWAGTIRDVLIEASNSEQILGGETKTFTTTISTETTNSVTENLSQTVGESLSVGLKTSLSVGGDAVGAKAGFEESIAATVTSEVTQERSTTNTVSTATSQSETTTITFNDSYRPGYYRRAVYANICDVYIAFKTNMNNELLDKEVIVCARPSAMQGGGYKTRQEWSIDGTFAYIEPVATILEAEDLPPEFWRNLPKTPMPDITTAWNTVRNDQKRIVEDSYDHASHPVDQVFFSSFTDADGNPINIQLLRTAGYKYITFKIQLDMVQSIHWLFGEYPDDGCRYVGLYTASDSQESEWTDDEDNAQYKTYSFSFANKSIDKFVSDGGRFFIRYKSQSGAWYNDWYNKNLKIQLVFKQ